MPKNYNQTIADEIKMIEEKYRKKANNPYEWGHLVKEYKLIADMMKEVLASYERGEHARKKQ